MIKTKNEFVTGVGKLGTRVWMCLLEFKTAQVS